MRFNKVALFSLLLTSWIAISNGSLINAPNPRLGFPSRSQSTANAVYSAIEWPLATFPHKQIEKEVKGMKKNILDQSYEQYKNLHPNAQFGYEIYNINRKKRTKETK